MIPLIWIRGLIIAGLIGTISTLGYLGYSKVKDIGYQEAATKYELVIKENEDKITAKIKTIENNSVLLVEQQRVANEVLSADVAKILKGVKGKTLTIVKNGECSPSPTFSDSFKEINKRVNESLK